jgi:hypothetical protein
MLHAQGHLVRPCSNQTDQQRPKPFPHSAESVTIRSFQAGSRWRQRQSRRHQFLYCRLNDARLDTVVNPASPSGPLASFGCAGEFGCYRCIANSGKLLAGRFMGSRPGFSPLPVTRVKIAHYECRRSNLEGSLLTGAVDAEVPTLLVSSAPWRIPLRNTESLLPVGSLRRWH